MKAQAVVFTAPRTVEFAQVTCPDPEPGEAIVRITHSWISNGTEGSFLRETVEFKAEHWSGGFTLMGYEPHNRGAAERALQLIADGAIDLAPLATHALPFTRYAEGVDLLRSKEAIKIRFLPWGE